MLFVSSGNSRAGDVDNLTKAQGESLKKAGINIVYYPLVGKGMKGYLRNVRPLRAFLKTSNFDILHAHFGLCGIITYLSKRKEKMVVSFMGDDLLGSVKSNGKYTLTSQLIAFLNRFFASYLYDFNIVKSNNLKSKLSPSALSEVIPNGVNFEVFFPIEKSFARTESGLKQDAKIILFAADPSRNEKNFDLAKRAVSGINNTNLELKVVHNIQQEELNRLYNAADVVLLTSRHEGSPNVIKEAMACNRPIVSTDVGDVREHLANTKGCFVSAPDSEILSQNIVEAMKFNSTTGRDSIAYLKSDYIAEKIINIYKNVLKR